jgi:two-component system, OmpR family, phosphate regulon sensor histidine kinase PhoR
MADPCEPVQSAYDLLFQNTSDGVLILDGSGILIRINPAAASMLRCVPHECLGKRPSAVYHDQPALLGLLTGAAAGSGELIRRIALPDKRIAQGIAVQQSDGGRMALLRDITERDELDSRREPLIRAIAHDLNNPISAIDGFADLVAMYGTLTPEQKRFLTRIRQTTQKLQNMLRPLVDLTWIESGMPMERVPVHLDKIIRDVVEELAGEAEQKRITFAVSTQQPMPPVIGDPARIRQVVYNLIYNALLYSQPEQPIAIHAFEDGREVRCSVADRGMGIKENEVEQIFDRLYRAQDDMVRNLPGGGIGLTMARAILKRHGGTIRAESVYGQGSTFIFTLPLA